MMRNLGTGGLAVDDTNARVDAIDENGLYSFEVRMFWNYSGNF
jgi:hypothetical protein